MTQPVLSRPVTERLPEGLAVVRQLFERLRANGVVYCHWKSNEHLVAGVRGDTDLDVLVDRQAPGLEGHLEESGFKRIAAVPARAYAGVDDFLAFDQATGKLAHLHLHYRLVLGEKNLKGYRLPWEPLVLETRRLDKGTGVFVSDPNLELILLMVRSALKLRYRDLPGELWRSPGLPSGTLDEFLWLIARVDTEQLRPLAASLLGAEAARILMEMTSGLPTNRQLRAFAKAAGPVLRTHRTYGAFDARRRRWSREWVSRWGALRNRLLGRPAPVRHTLPKGGLVIAFLGSDGSGKSTVTREAAAWLAWKLDVVPIYFGSGDGPVSVWRWPLRAATTLRAKVRRQLGDSPAANPPGGLKSYGAGESEGMIRAAWRLWSALAIAREKLDRLAVARRARNLGMIALCDRFPQSQVVGFNDGPQLGGWLSHRSRLLSAAAAWELEAYRSAELNSPDLVIKLHVTPEVAARRKDDMPQEDLVRRVGAVQGLRFPPGVRVVEIDATQPLDTVLLQVKQAIWEDL